MNALNIYDVPTRPSSEAEGGASVPFARAMGPDAFESSLTWVDYCIVKPGATIGAHRHVGDEEIYLILDGEGLMLMNDEEYRVGPGDATLLKSGGRHGLENLSGENELTVLVIDNRLPADPDAAVREDARAFVSLLRDVSMRSKPAHGGTGEIQVGDIFGPDALDGRWDFVQWVVVPAGSTIGYHPHTGDEEIYFVVAGEGVLTLDGQELPVGRGHLSIAKSGSSHGLRNTGPDELRFFVAQVPVQSK